MRRAFTLIELLIVVAIIAILAAIAVPNFLEAQTRSKVSRTKSDMRTQATALEAYCVDYNGYPACHRYGIALSNRDTNPPRILEVLSTPVSYITTADFKDPFSYRGRYSAASAQATAALTAPTVITAGTDLAASYNTYIYQSWNSEVRCSMPADNFTPAGSNLKGSAWVLHSVGPDGCYYNLGGILSADGIEALPYTIQLIYDATNGTVSRGSIFRTGGSSGGRTYKGGAGLQAAINAQK